jgi:hypothetical protein
LTELEPAPEADTEDAAEWHPHHNGERPDIGTVSALELAHKAVAKFPDLAKRYQKHIGAAAVLSSAIVVLASIAISRRLHKGESPERILAEITSEEIEGAHRKTENPKSPRKGITRFLR